MICKTCKRDIFKLEQDTDRCPMCLSDAGFITRTFIKSISVRNLFDIYDYDIDFENEDNTSILIAPNGFGKTTMFNLIVNIISPSLEGLKYIESIPFDTFDIYFQNGGKISFKKNETPVRIFDFRPFNFTYTVKPSHTEKSWSINMYNTVKRHMKEKSTHDIYMNIEMKLKTMASNMEDLACVSLISVKRLGHTIYDDRTAAIVYKQADKEYKSPLRQLLNKTAHIIRTSYAFKKYFHLKEKSSKYHKFSDEKEYFMKCMIAQIEEKTKLATRIFNERNKNTFKTIEFHQSLGIVIKQKDKKISIENLSSGELNDLIVLLRLIFVFNSDAVVIIDEPEVSLHIEWQETWLDYVLEIAKLNNLQIIVATHSPFIVNGHFELYADKKVTIHE